MLVALSLALASALAPSALADEAPPIVGGTATSDFPAVGALVLVSGSYSYGDFCSGTLVDANWVVTAAHCVDAAVDYERYGYDIYFVLGQTASDFEDYAQATALHMHPNYDGDSVNYDIGLLELAGSGLTSVTPVPMNRTHTPSSSWDEITYVGYGITRADRTDSGTKRTVSVAYYDYDTHFVYTLDPAGRANICSGDSGGAALWWDGSQYLLAGANSFGYNIYGGYPDCEGEGEVAGATRIDVFQYWIDDIMATGGGGSSGSSSGSGSGSSGSGSGSGSSGSGSGSSGSDGGSGSGSDGGSGSGSDGGSDDGGEVDDTPVNLETFGNTTAPEYGGCSVTGLGAVGFGALVLPAMAILRRRDD